MPPLARGVRSSCNLVSDALRRLPPSPRLRSPGVQLVPETQAAADRSAVRPCVLFTGPQGARLRIPTPPARAAPERSLRPGSRLRHLNGGPNGSLPHFLLRTHTRRPQPPLNGLQRNVVGNRRELDFDVEDGVRGEGISGPALLAEGGEGCGSCLEQGGCLHLDVVCTPSRSFTVTRQVRSRGTEEDSTRFAQLSPNGVGCGPVTATAVTGWYRGARRS